jgi:CelD/BcsL family acetyltransferase involved in cellulose biosynthesis
MISLVSSGQLRVREASTEEVAGWDNLVRRFDNHRIVHTTAWIRSLEASGFGRPRFLVLEENGEIVGCLPGLVAEVGPLRLFGSPPPASQTVSMGPAFDEQRLATPELMEALIPYLERRLGIHHIEIMSPDLDPGSMLAVGFRGEPWPTYRVPLFPHDEARTLKGMKENARRNVSRGIKLGLKVRFESDESFVDEHYDQIREVYVRGGNVVNFGRQRVLECFRHLRDAGNLVAVSVYLPDDTTSIATGLFTIEGKELLLWAWAHRAKYRWHRPTELMTWTVIQRALEAGCDTFDLMGLGEFKTKFGAKLDERKYRWVRSRYRWLAHMRNLAATGLHWQQAVRGRIARWSSSQIRVLERNGNGHNNGGDHV